MATTGDDTLTMCSEATWAGAPIVRRLFDGAGSRRLEVVDRRPRAPGAFGDLRSAIAMRRERAHAMRILRAMFVDHTEFDAESFAVVAFVDRLGLNLLLLPPSGRIVWISVQDVDDFVGYCAGYLGPRGWLWTDLHRRLSDLVSATAGSRRYASLVAS